MNANPEIEPVRPGDEGFDNEMLNLVRNANNGRLPGTTNRASRSSRLGGNSGINLKEIQTNAQAVVGAGFRLVDTTLQGIIGGSERLMGSQTRAAILLTATLTGAAAIGVTIAYNEFVAPVHAAENSPTEQLADASRIIFGGTPSLLGDAPLSSLTNICSNARPIMPGAGAQEIPLTRLLDETNLSVGDLLVCNRLPTSIDQRSGLPILPEHVSGMLIPDIDPSTAAATAQHLLQDQELKERLRQQYFGNPTRETLEATLALGAAAMPYAELPDSPLCTQFSPPDSVIGKPTEDYTPLEGLCHLKASNPDRILEIARSVMESSRTIQSIIPSNEQNAMWDAYEKTVTGLRE